MDRGLAKSTIVSEPTAISSRLYQLVELLAEYEGPSNSCHRRLDRESLLLFSHDLPPSSCLPDPARPTDRTHLTRKAKRGLHCATPQQVELGDATSNNQVATDLDTDSSTPFLLHLGVRRKSCLANRPVFPQHHFHIKLH